MDWEIGGGSQSATARNAAANNVVRATANQDREPDAAMPWIAERMMIPRISSMTAAPRIIWASGILSLPMPARTLAVIPTLVAVRAAPTNTASIPLRPRMD